MAETKPLRVQPLSTRRYRVHVVGGARRGATAPQGDGPDGEGRLRIGRVPEQPLAQPKPPGWILLRDEQVSRVHLELVAAAGCVLVRDASTNGTWVGGVRLRCQQVEVVDSVDLRVGQTELRLVLDPDDQPLAPAAPTFGDLVGAGAAMQRVFERVGRLAPHDVAVLITGETGTGKTVLARALHARSRRAGRAFVVIDCGAIAPGLVESELFGHARGAFTGAVGDRRGPFEEAEGGTVLLDEVGELPLDAQTRLLRVLEERVVRRVGDVHDRPVNVRVIAATNRDLSALVNAGRFRQDLYARLAVATVEVPPLRARPEDVGPIAEALVERIRARGDVVVPEGYGLPAEVVADLERREWPGNVRELLHHLETYLITGERASPRAQGPAAHPDASVPVADLLGLRHEDAVREVRLRFDRLFLRRHLRDAEGRVDEAARRAGLHRVTFTRLRKECGLPRSPTDSGDD